MLADRRFKMCDHASQRHIIWFSGFDFERSFGYEKAIHEMGATFAHN